MCVAMGFIGVAIYRYAASKEEQFRTRTLAFFKSFTLPWFAILGAHKALEHDLGIFSAIIIGLIAVAMKDSSTFFPVTLISVLVAFAFRVSAVKEHWKQTVPYAPPRDGWRASA